MTLLNTRQRDRLLLSAGIIFCGCLGWMLAGWFGLPTFRGFDASLLSQGSPVVAMVIAGVAILLGSGIATLIARSVRPDAGIYCAAVGLAVFSIRGGAIRYTLLDATGPGVFVRLAVELLLLFAVFGVAWLMIHPLRKGEFLMDDAFRDGFVATDSPIGQKVLATGTQVVGMTLFMALLGRSDDKVQALAAVGVAAWGGAIVSHYLYQVQPAIIYWIGPLVTGLLGYVWAYVAAGSEAWTIGLVPNPLCVAQPLDYASFGIAGAILGYWTCRRWLVNEAENAPVSGSVQS